MERSKRIRDFLAFCLGILLAGGLMQALHAFRGGSAVIPGGDAIVRAFWQLVREGAVWRQTAVTLRHLVEALLLSTVIGVLIGMAEGASDFVRTLFRPIMFMLRSIPMIVMVVAVMILVPRVRYAWVPRITACLLLVPLISEAACEGWRRMEPEWIDVYRLNSGFNLQVLLRVYLPLMAGYLQQAYLNAVGMGLRMVVSAEYLVQVRDSLGKAVFDKNYNTDFDMVYAYALLMILLALALSVLPLRLRDAVQWARRRRSAD